ncbi:hypothetical protein FG386_001164 [Cryptosporidium ryanae]|uniref:uncharacterized protein n=1 Tax=Cryptosporidium ryanae TaxID=515981 RepID=UPI00351A3497|nr:hypothetical protein FG386_001164 [Cryptosporidium ryanae]
MGNNSRVSDSNNRNLFNETVREIRKLVYPHLDKFQRQQYEDMRAKVLGIKQKKSQKMPLPELLSRQKATKRHIENRKKLEQELNIKLHVGDKANRFQVAKENKDKRRMKMERRINSGSLSGRGFSEKSGVVYALVQKILHFGDLHYRYVSLNNTDLGTHVSTATNKATWKKDAPKYCNFMLNSFFFL